jgi:hypothetical protein
LEISGTKAVVRRGPETQNRHLDGQTDRQVN